MILADKIIRLRKKNGWSQEELAEKMNVSRQAVSKWEGAQTVPDLEKILQLADLFGVTTDYLLKDELEEEAFTESSMDFKLRKVTMQQANEYLALRKNASLLIAMATLLCILSPIPLILLSAATEYFAFSEALAVGIGMAVLFIAVAIAVALYVFCGFKNAPYAFLDKEFFETEYGVQGMVREKQKVFRPLYVRMNVVATCLCVLSPLPLVLVGLTGHEFATVAALAATMIMAGIGTAFFIIAGVRYAGMQRLLREGEFSEREKKNSKLRETVETAYWLTATAIYLAWSFITNDWARTWILWPVAGVLSGVLSMICNLVLDKKEN